MEIKDELPSVRECAYGNFLSRLEVYRARRDQGASPAELKRVLKTFPRMSNRAVWIEMKRSREHLPELSDLFAAAPEALDW